MPAVAEFLHANEPAITLEEKRQIAHTRLLQAILRQGETAGVDEEQVIDSVLRGNRNAFRQLVERHEPAVFGLCRKLLGYRDTEAEDLAQETFVRAYQRLGQLNDPRRFGSWLYRIARSLCRDRMRRLATESKALRERALQVRSPPKDNSELRSVVDSLPREERIVLELRYFDGLTYAEIAESSGLSFSKVDHLIRRARSRLKHRLEVQKRIQKRMALALAS